MGLELQPKWEAMGLIDLDASFFVQLGLFLLFMLLMNALLIKPLLRIFDARKERTRGAKEIANSEEIETRALVERYETKLSAALDEGAELRTAQRAEGVSKMQATVAAARKQHDEVVVTGSREAHEAYDSSLRDVERAAQPLADAIVARLLQTENER